MRKIDIVGFGIGGAGNMTLRANALVAGADVLFTLVTSPELENYLVALKKYEVIDLISSYQLGLTGRDIYEDIANKILTHKEWSNAVFLVEGNPQLYNIPVRLVREGCILKGWECSIHPAISSLDTILIDLDLEIEEGGIQIMDAARMLRDELYPSPKIDCILFQIAASTVTTFIDVDSQNVQLFKPLVDFLGKVYHETTPFLIIRSGMLDDEAPKITRTTVGSFPDFSSSIDYNCSAYIPKEKS